MDIDFTNKEAANQAGDEPIPLPVLQLVSEARNEHGMRQQDFTRYRHFCASKTHRMRETLEITSSDGKQKAAAAAERKGRSARGKRLKKAQAKAAQSAATKGTGNVFTPKTLKIQDVKNDRAAQLLLFEAERAWAFSQDLRNQAFENDSDPALRKRGISRLRRAVQWSQQLVKLVNALNSRFDVYSRAEAAAYSIILEGTAAFDRSQWDKVLVHLSVARKLLGAIAESSKTSRSEALANSFVDAGEAQIRYSAYQLGESEQNMDAVADKMASNEVCESVLPGFEALVQELKAEASKAGAAKTEPLSVSWHGHQIPIRNPELLDSITRAQAAEKALHEAIKSGYLQEDSRAIAKQSSSKSTSHGKRPRLSHAERNAKRREMLAAGGTSQIGKAGRTELDPFDRALSALTDAEDVARRLVEDNAEALAKSHSARYETQSKDLQTAHDYILYRLLALRIARNSRLVSEVERKAEKRDRRALASVEARFSSQKVGRSSSGGNVTSKRAKAKREQEKAAQQPKKNQPGSKAKRARTTPRTFARRPARSGTRTLRSRQASARVARARAMAEAKSRRRGARAVPSLAKLLDGAETSLTAMASISLVESEPDVSSLVEAKGAWYRSELLRHLARAFTLSGSQAEALLLITRAQLFVRQARQAAELADEVEEEDQDFPPAITQSRDGETAFDALDRILEALKRQIQKDLYFATSAVGTKGKGKKKASRMADTKAGQALMDMANKYVDFDPVDLAEAKRIPADVVEECQQGKRGVSAKQAAAAQAPITKKQEKVVESAPVKKEVAPLAPVEADEAAEEQEAGAAAAEEEEDQVLASGDVSFAYDPGNALAEEEEARLEAEAAANKKRGWLGGWFGRS